MLFCWMTTLLLLFLTVNGQQQVNGQPPPPDTPPLRSTVYPNGQCPILHLLPFGVPFPRPLLHLRGQDQDAFYATLQANNRVSYAWLAAAEMARRHFNQRNPVIVPQLANTTLMGACPTVQLSPQLVRATKTREAGVISLFQDGQYYQNLTSSSTSTNSSTSTTPMEERYPCAILGPDSNHAASELTSASAALGITQVTVSTDNDKVLGRFKGNTLGNVLSIEGRVTRLLHYLGTQLQQSHMIAIMEEHAEFQSVTSGFVRLHPRLLDTVRILYWSGDNLPENVLKQVQLSGIRTIYFGLLDPDKLWLFANAMEDMGMLDGDYLVVLTRPLQIINFLDDLVGPQLAGSPIDKFLVGALMVDRMDPFERTSTSMSDRFLKVWKQQDGALVQDLNDMVPPGTPETRIQRNSDYFQTSLPARYSSYVYDAVISIGLGACQLAATEGQKSPNEQLNEPPRSADAPPPPGMSHDGLPPTPPLVPLLNAIMHEPFHGASGKNRFISANSIMGHRTRNPDDIYTGIFNVQAGPTDPETGLRTYTRVLTSVWEPDRQWQYVVSSPFIYSNGSTDPPKNFVIADENFLDDWVRFFGFALLASAWALAFGAIILVWYFRQDNAVRTSQPTFQITLCLGSAVLATSIYTLSHDESNGMSDSQLDVACIATPWFFFFGQVIMFCSLFTKLMRLDQVLQFTRRRVGVKDVLMPVFVLCAITFCLLTVWTTLDPWKWNREMISPYPPETYGACESEDFWTFFGPLMAVVLVAEVSTVFFAKKTSDAPEALRDSNYIFLAIATQIQAWIVGVPILAVLKDSSAGATYLGRIFLIWVLSVSSVILVVWPRILNAIQIRRNPDFGRPVERVRISGLVGSPVQAKLARNASGDGSSKIIPVLELGTDSSTHRCTAEHLFYPDDTSRLTGESHKCCRCQDRDSPTPSSPGSSRKESVEKIPSEIHPVSEEEDSPDTKP